MKDDCSCRIQVIFGALCFFCCRKKIDGHQSANFREKNSNMYCVAMDSAAIGIRLTT